MKLLKKIFGFNDRPAQPANVMEWTFGATDVGKERTNNEDYFLISPKKSLYIVADGMGGHNAGEVASLNAVEAVNEYLAAELLYRVEVDGEQLAAEMQAALQQANRKLLEMAGTNADYRGMGCTIVVALIIGNDLHLCHVGDARAYAGSKEAIKLLTTDHSKVMDLVKAGQMQMEEARTSPLKNELNQAIGSPMPIEPEYTHYALKDRDKVLLCSDGLWDMLTDEDIHKILLQAKPVKALCEELIASANEAGGHDNITVVVIEHHLRDVAPKPQKPDPEPKEPAAGSPPGE
jgi:PPM family protein phosphatase